MSSVLIPKEQQTAYQRWEMSAFTEDLKQASRTKMPAENASVTAKKPTAVKQSDNELGHYLVKARQDGFELGKKEGLEVGINQAKSLMTEHTQTLQQMTQAFGHSIQHSNDEISNNLLSLALDIAKAMLKTNIDANPTVVIPVIQDALKQLPYIQHPALLMLNPADLEVVKAHLGSELAADGWVLRENTNIERGGCLIETGANQIDASNNMRWKRICEALGKNDTWQLA